MQRPTFITMLICGALCAAAACKHDATDAPATPVPFACADSIARADGSTQTTTCDARMHYCYEATGGAAISHGAHCKALPKASSTCDDLRADGRCSGQPSTGLRVNFTFP